MELSFVPLDGEWIISLLDHLVKLSVIPYERQSIILWLVTVGGVQVRVTPGCSFPSNKIVYMHRASDQCLRFAVGLTSCKNVAKTVAVA